MEPIDLRLYLRYAGHPLTETWLYQWKPPPLTEPELMIDAAFWGQCRCPAGAAQSRQIIVGLNSPG